MSPARRRETLARVAWLAFAALSLGPTLSRSQTLDPNTWTFNGPVNAIACTGKTVYVGGNFTVIAPFTGSGAEVHLGGTAKPFIPALVRGSVTATISDDHGGWFIAGRFTEVGGAPHRKLAHILADGRVAGWDIDVDGYLRGMGLRHDTLFVWGDFLHIGGRQRMQLAALDASTGATLAWDARIQNGGVYGVALDGPTLYVGGLFEFVNYEPRSNIAAVEIATARPTSWAPNANAPVGSILASEGIVYIAGRFDRVDGQPRRGLAAIDGESGHVTPWNPGPYGNVLAANHRAVYFNGVALDRRTAERLPWDPRANSAIRSIVLRGNHAYLAGDFTELGGAPRPFLAEVDARTGEAAKWSPCPNGPVSTIAPAGAVTYVGGEFSGIGGVERRFLAALDADTGLPTEWNPSPHSPVGTNPFYTGMRALAVNASTLYVSGVFDSVAGAHRDHLAAFDARTGALTSWCFNTNAAFDRIVATDSVVYLSGGFALEATTGALLEWSPRPTYEWRGSDVRGPIYAMAVDRQAMYLGGYFEKINGEPRNDLAAVDRDRGDVLPWAPSLDGTVRAIEVRDGRVVVGGDVGCFAFDQTTAAPLWQAPQATTALLGLEDLVYRAYGEPVLEALDAATGVPTGWQATFTYPPVGPFPSVVDGLASDGRHLYAVGLFDHVNGMDVAGFARFLLPGAAASVPRGQRVATRADERATELACYPDPARDRATIRFALPTAGPATLSIFDLQGRRVSSLLDEAPLAAGIHEIPLNTSGWRAGVYVYRLEAAGTTSSRKLMIVR
jgi:outer membrane protein assembly factor BamB